MLALCHSIIQSNDNAYFGYYRYSSLHSLYRLNTNQCGVCGGWGKYQVFSVTLYVPCNVFKTVKVKLLLSQIAVKW